MAVLVFKYPESDGRWSSQKILPRDSGMENSSLFIMTTLVGLALLLIGRQLFWVFVAAAGFILGSSLASQFLIGQSTLVISAVGLAAGLVGVVVAVFAQNLAIGVAGFVMGSYILAFLFYTIGLVGTGWTWLALIGGGIIASALVLALFDLALIALSSLAGANLIIQITNFSPVMTSLVFILLVAIGAVVQVSMLKRNTHDDR